MARRMAELNATNTTMPVTPPNNITDAPTGTPSLSPIGGDTSFSPSVSPISSPTPATSGAGGLW
eukprot:CAMPEP_0172494952 /NCGR_PEP_ID=MMETSP1066-20121228/59576_1 /TAXON_ID=671091 /ORGANISM="Coscinodiscus wailesii, Strain CCMP2513" /LENGTH=63 /DNA_ID=CAMNT_0013266303 /DNA_START=165 /DNA_END=353 /DNA_ORIENTATION=+